MESHHWLHQDLWTEEHELLSKERVSTIKDINLFIRNLQNRIFRAPNFFEKLAKRRQETMNNATGNDIIFGRYEFIETSPHVAVPCVIVLVLASLVGVFGNSLILVAVWLAKTLDKEEAVLITNLAISDMYVTLIADPLSLTGKLSIFRSVFNAVFSLVGANQFFYPINGMISSQTPFDLLLIHVVLWTMKRQKNAGMTCSLCRIANNTQYQVKSKVYRAISTYKFRDMKADWENLFQQLDHMQDLKREETRYPEK